MARYFDNISIGWAIKYLLISVITTNILEVMTSIMTAPVAMNKSLIRIMNMVKSMIR